MNTSNNTSLSTRITAPMGLTPAKLRIHQHSSCDFSVPTGPRKNNLDHPRRVPTHFSSYSWPGYPETSHPEGCLRRRRHRLSLLPHTRRLLQFSSPGSRSLFLFDTLMILLLQLLRLLNPYLIPHYSPTPYPASSSDPSFLPFRLLTLQSSFYLVSVCVDFANILRLRVLGLSLCASFNPAPCL